MTSRHSDYRLGSIIGIEGESIKLFFKDISDGLPHGYVAFGENDRGVIESLMTEVGLLRKIVKEMVRREGVHVSSPNEFHRGLASFAQKIKEDPDVVWELLKPYYEDFLKEMFERPTRRQAHGSHDHSRRGSRRPGGGH